VKRTDSWRVAALAGLVTVTAPLAAGSRVPPVASYVIEAAWDAGNHALTGRERVTFVNRTGISLPDLRLHLYLNAWRNDRSTWLTENEEGIGRARRAGKDAEWFGWTEINRIALADGTDLTPGLRFLAPDDGNAEDRTLVSVPLPRPIAPGETLVFSVDWASRFPRTVARTGWKDDFVMGAQWFPKLCKATPAGWHSRQFHAGTEFWADFGDYDVTLTLPKEMKGKVGASGVQKEEQEVGGSVRVRFVAEDVHDFAWTASPRYEVFRETFTHPGLPNVEMILLLQPDHRRAKDRYFAATRAALAGYGTRYTPYPYSVVTVVDPPWGSASGGMEYPTLFTGGTSWLSPEGSQSPESVTVHEFGHQIFYGILASDEFDEAHMDEGFNTYAQDVVLKQAFGDPVLVKRFFGLPVVFRSVVLPRPEFDNDRYQTWQLASRSDATSVPSWSQLDGAAIRINAYSKTALTLASAERTLGPGIWAKIMRTYATRFAFRNPTAADFRAVVKEIAGDAGDALFHAAWDSAETFDYAVSKAEAREIRPAVGWIGDGAERRWAGPAKPDPQAPKSWESLVVVRRMGGAVWPVDVELAFEGGHVVRKTWDGAERWIRYRCTGPRLLAARVDPDRKLLLDVNLLNNGLKTTPDGRAASLWSSRLTFWAQNVLEFFALLGFASVPR
jgi:hypothetical protein